MEKEGTKVESLEKNNGSNGNHRQSSSVIILGSGSSGCTPEFACLIHPSDPPCKVYFDSLSLPPEQSPNYRCNTSLLIDYCPGGSDHSYIMIDVGKTFRPEICSSTGDAWRGLCQLRLPFWGEIQSFHFSFFRRPPLVTLNAVRRICPKRTLLVGMSHDFDYCEHNKILEEWSKEEGIPVQLARDGVQIFTVDL